MITRAENARARATVSSREPPSTTTISSHHAMVSRQRVIIGPSSWQTTVADTVGSAGAGAGP